MTVNCHSPWPIENAVFLVIQMQIRLQITTRQVQSGEPFDSSQHIQIVLNSGSSILIYHCSLMYVVAPARKHMDLNVGGFISNPTISWIQNMEYPFTQEIKN
jgi:hypothetical protein